MFHYGGAACFTVVRRAFVPTSQEQTKLWGKSKAGWIATETPAWGLVEVVTKDVIHDYVSKCVPHCLGLTHPDIAWAFHPRQTPTTNSEILNDAVRLWTANHLLLQGWQALDTMPVIEEADSPYCGMAPAPRVMQNALDASLESYVAEKETSLLAKINAALDYRKDVASWEEIIALPSFS